MIRSLEVESVRNLEAIDISDDVVRDCILHASLAPNSSNLQLWEFYHVTSKKLMKKISYACFNQPAIRTASQFVVVVTEKTCGIKEGCST